MASYLRPDLSVDIIAIIAFKYLKIIVPIRDFQNQGGVLTLLQLAQGCERQAVAAAKRTGKLDPSHRYGMHAI